MESLGLEASTFSDWLELNITEECVMPSEWVKQMHSSCLQLSIGACTRVTLSFYKIVRLLASGPNMKIQLFEYRGRKAAIFYNIIK